MLAPCQDLPDRASLLYHFHRGRRYFQRRPDKSAGMFPRGELGPMGRKSETELYLPVKAYFEERGFKVRAEVRNCDLAAVKEDSLVIVELKTSFNLELVLQGVERQQICAAVFLAVPRPRNMQTSRWRRILRLCRALGLGLLTVSAHGLVEAVCQPLGQAPRQNRREKKLLLREIADRSGDFNTGGSQPRPLVTAYREQALRIANYIGQSQQRPRDIVRATGIAKAPSILQKNYYHWFERVERGVYQLSPLGYQALVDYAQVIQDYIKKDSR